MDIGINYITEENYPQKRYNDIYKLLIRNGYINTLKFPGKYCNYETLKNFFNLVEETNVKIDMHGLPNMEPSINSKRFIENINWNIIKQVIQNEKNIYRFSTHMGLENKDKVINYTKLEAETIFNDNINKLKCKLKEILKHDIRIGLENIPGGFEYDLKTIMPEYISNIWEKVDFGIFDIAHAKLAAKELNISYKEYLNRLNNKEKVEILHISGDVTNKYTNRTDKHIMTDSSEIKDIIYTLKQFNNTDLIITEYAYNTQYKYEKELIIESITLYTIVKTMQEKRTQNINTYLKANLTEDISNIKDIINSKELKQLLRIK